MPSLANIRKSPEEEETARVISQTARVSGGTKNLRGSFGRPKTSTIPDPSHVNIPSRRGGGGGGGRRNRKLQRRAFRSLASLRSSSGSLDFAARRYQLSPAISGFCRAYPPVSVMREAHTRHTQKRARAHACTTPTISISWFSASRSFRSAIKMPRRRVTQRLRIVSALSRRVSFPQSLFLYFVSFIHHDYYIYIYIYYCIIHASLTRT